ncbi:MAG TPA: HD domain-containing protein [Bryobacteraceae bacterium]|nr:HD domain-containing protein [Bryobacteraceae bacterium]
MQILLPAALGRIVAELRESGYRGVVVGGAVRDALLDLPVKDFDLEVYGISYERLAAFLASRGRVDLVGKSFGVVKFTAPAAQTEPSIEEAAWDFSIPRRDSKTGPAHRDFNTQFDASITPREAAARRDFTMNAMAYDPLTGEILDFFGGRQDLARRILRATSEAFSEDPLRVLRGMQFACRFDLTLDDATAAMSRAVASEYETLAKERIAEEFMKWAVKSRRPGRIAEYLAACGWLRHFPEIEAMAGVPQDPDWHPEGDVSVHTMYVLDAAARIAERDGLEGDDRAVLLFAALGHDFGKPATTERRPREGRMRWTSWGHEPLGGPIARQFLTRIGIKSAIVDQVVPLIENHLAHRSIGMDTTPRAVRRLALRLAPASVEQLIRLIEADASGRPPKDASLPAEAEQILAAARAESVAQKPQPPLILGRHVLPYFDNRPGVHIGEVTNAAYEAQADGKFSTEEEALQWLESYMVRVPKSIE